jgi:hypothetical protein
MTGRLDGFVELNKQFADQRQRENAAGNADVRNHPFDWSDVLLIVMPVATMVFAMFWAAE